jgi:hypothetical protein
VKLGVHWRCPWKHWQDLVQRNIRGHGRHLQSGNRIGTCEAIDRQTHTLLECAESRICAMAKPTRKLIRIESALPELLLQYRYPRPRGA